jgi:hypothetical protein
MLRPATRPLGNEFDDFLFAPMGEDRNGAPLSVISALARLNIDPWKEAADLARLPLDAAARKLTSLIATLPVGSSALADPGTMAHRLVALLRAKPAPHTPSASAAVSAVPDKPTMRSTVIRFTIYYVIAITLILACQWAMAADSRGLEEVSANWLRVQAIVAREESAYQCNQCGVGRAVEAFDA